MLLTKSTLQARFGTPMRYIGALLVFAAIYWATARLGLVFATLNKSASPVWPATGVSIGLLVLFGRRFWPAIALGAFVANLQADNQWSLALAIAAGNALEAAAGALMIERLARKDQLFGAHSMSIAVVGGAVFASMVSATVGVAGLWLASKVPMPMVSTVWLTWWTGDVLGGLLVTPLLLTWGAGIPEKHSSPRRLLTVVVVGVVLCGMILTHTLAAPFLFMLFPYFLWCIAVLNDREAKAVAIAVATGCIVSTQLGWGAFRDGNTNGNLIHLQLFLSSFAITALLLSDFKRRQVLSLPAVMVLLAGWVLSGAIFGAFHRSDERENRVKFDAVVADIEPFLQAKAQMYFTALHGGAGLFAASKSVERDEWRAFFEQSKFKEQLSALMGLGVIFQVPKGELPAFLDRTRLDGAPDFTYQRVPNGQLEVEDSYMITYVEPKEVNQREVGLDLASEGSRKWAADRARDSGEAVISETVALVQDQKGQPGFLIIYPIYSHGPLPTTVAERRQRLTGWVYAPVRSANFFGMIGTNSSFDELKYSVVNGTGTMAVAQSEGFSELPKVNARIVNLMIGGQPFRVTVKPSAVFMTVVETSSSWAAAAAEFLTLLLGALIVSLQSVKVRATQLAAELTQELQRSQASLQTLFATLPVGVTVLDGAGKVKSINQALSRIMQVDLGGLRAGTHTSRRYLRADGTPMPAVEFPSACAIRTRSVVSATEIGVVLEDGSHVWTEVSAAPLSEADASCVLVTQDITARKQGEKQLAQSAKLASLGEMAGGIAHEINNPLAIIAGIASRLKRGLAAAPVDTQAALSDVAKISATVDRIAKIVKGLKTFSRTGDKDPFESTSLPQLITETLSLCQERFKAGGIPLNVSDLTELAIECRATGISQVLLNLLNNAFDAVSAQTEKWVRIEVKKLGLDKVQIRVTDSGPGIPPEIADRLMQPFFTTKQVGKGTGLGLSISRGIAQDHGGSLTLDRTSANTCFVLELAIQQLNAQVQSAA